MAGYTRHVDMSDEQVANLHAWKAIVARAWADDAFKQELLAEPNRVLAENGFKVPTGVTFTIVEDTADQRHLILPAAPGGDVSVVEHGSNSDYDPGF